MQVTLVEHLFPSRLDNIILVGEQGWCDGQTVQGIRSRPQACTPSDTCHIPIAQLHPVLHSLLPPTCSSARCSCPQVCMPSDAFHRSWCLALVPQMVAPIIYKHPVLSMPAASQLQECTSVMASGLAPLIKAGAYC